MAIKHINIGAAPNDKTGTPARQAGQMINENFDYLDSKISNVNKVITAGTYILVGQSLTIYVGWVWEINGQQFYNPADVVINFPYSATGKQRFDRLVFNTSNTFSRIAGAESVSNPIAEPVPSDTLDFGISLVTDNLVGEVIPPEDLSQKLDRGGYSGTAQDIVSSIPAPVDISSKLDKGGYAGTAQDLANLIPDLNAVNLRFGGYPNTRNDGQISMNKVLTTDSNGYLKLVTIAVAPAPYLEELIPDSYLPSTTGNFILKGSFFTPNMGITIEGQTINYKTFISDNEFRVNVTTGSAEGTFDVTLNNGISQTFPDVLLIVLGTVFTPMESDWQAKSNIDVSVGDFPKVTAPDVSATAYWLPPVDYSKNWRISFKYVHTPLNPFSGGNSYLRIRSATNILLTLRMITNLYVYTGNSSDLRAIRATDLSKTIEIRKVGSLITLYKDNGELILTVSDFVSMSENMRISLDLMNMDISDLKYIETA